MAKLLGKAPNQVPTNADLGSMAFQDREGINVNTAVVANLVVTGATSVNTTFAVTNASATVLFAGANGNVGIGNNTPTFKMVVDGGATTTTSVVRSTSGYAELFLSGTSASYLSSNTSLNVWANGATRMFVAANGNIGISNTTPDASLTITGTANISGNVVIGGSTRIYGPQTTFGGNSVALWTGTHLYANASTRSLILYAPAVESTGAPFIFDTPNAIEFRLDSSPILTLNSDYTTTVNSITTFSKDVIMSGNLTVSGTTTYINTTQLNIGDNIITLNADLPGATAPTESAGIEVNRGSSANVSFIWNESGARWEANPGNNSSNELRLVSNTLARAMSMTGGGLVDSWGTVANTGEFATFNVSSGVNKFRTNSRDYYISNTASDHVMVSAANGNVGIGNNTPGAALQVTSKETAGAGATLVRFGTLSDPGRIRFIDENSTGSLPPMITSPSAAFGLGIAADQGSGPIIFYTGGTANTTNEKVRLVANGNFGIGTVTPGERLSISGVVAARVTSNTAVVVNYLENSNTGTGVQTIQRLTAGADKSLTHVVSGSGFSGMYGSATAPSFFYDFDTHTFRKLDGTGLAVFAANGNIGFGNGTPTTKLTVTSAAYRSASLTSAITATPLTTDAGQIFDITAATGTAGLTFGAGDARFLTFGADPSNRAYVRGYALNLVATTDVVVSPNQNIAHVFAANGNVGFGNTTPVDRLSVTGTITATGSISANNIRRYVMTRTLSTTVNDTVNIGTFTSTIGGVQELMIAIQVSDGSFSVAKQYHIVSAYNATAGTTYRRVLPLYDTGPFSNDFELEAYHNFDDLVLRLRRSVGSTAGTAEILIDDLIINNGTDSFTPSTTTASAVAAVTDLFPGNRLLNTGGNHATPNTFIVQANLTTAAITSNNTVTALNLPVSFGSYTSLGFSSFVNLGLTTSATTANQVLSTFSASGYRSAKFFVQVTSGSAYQATEITLIHDGTNVYKSEYGQVFSGAVLATFDADINSGNVRLLTTPTNAVTVYKGLATQILI